MKRGVLTKGFCTAMFGIGAFYLGRTVQGVKDINSLLNSVEEDHPGSKKKIIVNTVSELLFPTKKKNN